MQIGIYVATNVYRRDFPEEGDAHQQNNFQQKKYYDI